MSTEINKNDLGITITNNKGKNCNLLYPLLTASLPEADLYSNLGPNIWVIISPEIEAIDSLNLDTY